MTAPLHRIIEGLRVLQRHTTPRGLIKAGTVARENEGRFLLDMVEDAIKVLDDADRNDHG